MLFQQELLATFDPERLPLAVATEYHDKCDFHDRLISVTTGGRFLTSEQYRLSIRNAREEFRAASAKALSQNFTHKQLLEAIRLVGEQRDKEHGKCSRN